MTSFLPSPFPGGLQRAPGSPNGSAPATLTVVPDLRSPSLVDPHQFNPRDLAYAAALADAADRMGEAAGVAELWPLVVEEAVTLVAAAGAAVVERRGPSWCVLAARLDDPAVTPARITAGIDAAARRGLLDAPGLVNELVGPSPAGWRTLLVAALDRRPSRVATRLLWFGDRPGAFAGRVDVADLLSRHAGAAARFVSTRESLNQAVEARQRVGQAVGILMAVHRLTPEAAYALMQERSQLTNTKLRTIAEQVIWTGNLPAEERSD